MFANIFILFCGGNFEDAVLNSSLNHGFIVVHSISGGLEGTRRLRGQLGAKLATSGTLGWLQGGPGAHSGKPKLAKHFGKYGFSQSGNKKKFFVVNA